MESHKIIAVLLGLLIIITGSALATVNTEAMRFQTELPGFTINLNASGSYNGGNSDYIDYSGQLRFDYRNTKNHTFYVANFNRGESNEELYANSGFMHLRYVRTLNHRAKLEFFSQLEYDDFLNIERRALAGGGFRLNILRINESVNFHLGIAAMWEQEIYTDPEMGANGEWVIPPEDEKNLLRSTNYLTGDWYISQHASFSMTAYYQPDVGNSEDYRLLIDSELQVNFGEHFYFNTIINYRVDSQPPQNLKREDVSITNGLGFFFNISGES